MRPMGIVVPSLVLVALLPLTCRCFSLTGSGKLRHGYISGIGGAVPPGIVYWIGNGGVHSRCKTNSRMNKGWRQLRALPLWTCSDFFHEKRHRGPEFVLWVQGGGDEESPTKRRTEQAAATENVHANNECSKNESTTADISEESEKTEGKLDPNAKLNAMIVGLEKKLKETEKDLDVAKANILDRGKTGYLKLVAKVDNYRKQKEEESQRQHHDAAAGVLRSLLPILDALQASNNEIVANTEEEERIISNYGVIFSEFMAAFKKLGMVEYVARNGSYFESHMHSKVGEEYNDKISRNYVITGIKPGLKVHEIVIRPAECIVSLGKEQTDEKRGEGETDIADEESEVQENAVEADVE